MSYKEFLQSKAVVDVATGLTQLPPLNPRLMPYQADIVRWALKRGRAALFEDCGLGKSFQQLEWARVVCEHTGGDVLILAPLAVAAQTVAEGAKFGIKVTLCKSQDDILPGINITNYDRLENFEPNHFAGVVLDESSILKAFSGKTRMLIIESFAQVPYRLACTATPAPNDFMELGNHAQFLGVMNQRDMLARFFVHDGGETQKWRLKGHAESEFWQWVCSWACMVRKPSDLGYEDGSFSLPPLSMHSHIIGAGGEDAPPESMTLSERQAARRETIAERAQLCADMVNSTSGQWLIWCDLNAESEALTKAIHCAVEVRGSDKPDHKEMSMVGFAAGNIRVLISKSSICGFGMNFQSCNQMAFVGLSDSFEQMYQAIRRCWRFGQTQPVHCHIITSSREGAVLANIRRKEADAAVMADAMAANTKAILRESIESVKRDRDGYEAKATMVLPKWMKVAV